MGWRFTFDPKENKVSNLNMKLFSFIKKSDDRVLFYQKIRSCE